MRVLSRIPLLLFGLVFAGGGCFFLAEMAFPMWDNWQRAQDWRPAFARLVSVSGGDNETRAQYRYEYNGSTYVGDQVGVSVIKDNIGSYHADMRAYLRRAQQNNQALPIWVNPVNPSEAVIDREMRWGLFAFMVGFCSIFILIGLAVVYGGLTGSKQKSRRRGPSLWKLRKRWQTEKAAGNTDLEFLEFCQQQYGETDVAEVAQTPVDDWQSRKGWEDAQIGSNAGKGVLGSWLIALIWNGVSYPILWVIPEELDKENYLALLIVLFPLAGLILIYRAIRQTLELKRFGRVLLQMDPFPGAIGGHVGGHLQIKKLDYRVASEAEKLSVTLECVYSYVSGSGKNRSRRESVKWAEQGKPRINNSIEGVNLSFRFDVPEGLPQADVEQSGDYHFWRLSIVAEIPGIDLNRNYNIPVFATGETSRNVSHDVSAQVAATRQQEADAAALAMASGQFDIEGLSRAMQLKQEGNQIRMKFPMFRNKGLTLFAAVFAGGFGFACYMMTDLAFEGGLFGIFIAVFSIPFFLVALVAGIATIYLPFNNLRVRIQPSEISVLRRLLIFPVYRRVLRREEISHLSTKRSGSTGQGVNKVEHYKIYAHARNGGKVTLAEDIDGEHVASKFRDYLAQRIGVSTD